MTEKTRKKIMRLPVLQGILPLTPSQVPADILAGITLAALSIPEVMGYSKIAGTPVITGLYTILIPITIFAIFGSSRHLVVGADSATAAILAGALTGIVAPGSNEWVAMAGILALISAGFLIMARIVRLGFLADFLSRTVLIGFLTGVGVQIAAGEISGMLGIPSLERNPILKLVADIRQVGQTNLYDLAVSLAVLIVIVGSKRISKKVPGALIAVIGATIASSAFGLSGHGVHVLGLVPSGLPRLGLPDIYVGKSLILRLLPASFAMFVVILAQSAATSRAYAARYDEHLNENLDLIGLSLANVGAALSGTFVVNGSPTKTQMVDSAGGISQLSQVVTGLVVLMVLMFLTGPLASMPSAVLSAVVFLIGMELIDVKEMRRIWVQRPSEFWVALVAAVVVIGAGVEQGILLAMALSLIEHVRRSYRSKNAVLATDASGGWRTLPVTAPEQILPGLLIYRFAHTMYYANAEQLTREVASLSKGAEPALDWFCIDASAVADVDFTAAAALREVYYILQRRGVRLVLANVIDLVRAELDRYELTGLIGMDSFYEDVGEVLSSYRDNASSALISGRSS